MSTSVDQKMLSIEVSDVVQESLEIVQLMERLFLKISEMTLGEAIVMWQTFDVISSFFPVGRGVLIKKLQAAVVARMSNIARESPNFSVVARLIEDVTGEKIHYFN